jgi:riboflavin biosynthesis pyrimidine reductase
MTALSPLDTFVDAAVGEAMPLPPALSRLYGSLRFPAYAGRAHVFGNVVSSLDGVVSLGIPGQASGRAISGDNSHDRLVMGLLRAVADVIVVGSGTFHASSRRRWTAEAALPDLADTFAELLANLGKSGPPLNVVVTRSGNLDLDRPSTGGLLPPLLVVTTADGAARLRDRGVPPSAELVVLSSSLTAGAVLTAVHAARPAGSILVEAGPRLMGAFVAERCLDELFLTIAPQIAGDDEALPRPGLVASQRFAPDDPRWASLVSLKRAGSYLFTRYALGAPDASGSSTSARPGSTTEASTK